MYTTPTVPEANELVVMLTGGSGGGGAGATPMLSAWVAFCAGAEESVTLAVKEKLPLCVGVPEIAPAAESVNPGGSVPEARLHIYGIVPPVAARVALYTTPTVPEANELVVMLSGGGGAGATVILSALLTLCAGEEESVTRTVNEKLPLCVGVPEITPALESVNPGASVPEATLHAYGVVPPVAAWVALYTTPTVPEAKELVVMLTGGGGAGATVILSALLTLCAGEEESVTRTVREKLPLCVGVPEIAPAAESVNPGGSVPEARLHIYGVVPPAAAKLEL